MTTNRDPHSRKWCWLVASLMVATPAVARQDADERNVESAGDYLQFGVPLAALALTVLFDDAPVAGKAGLAGMPGSELDVGWPELNGSPRHDLALAIGRTEVVTYGLKYSVTEERPNGGGHSFPSGHTSVAFSGA